MNDANQGHRRRLPGRRRAEETPSDEAVTHTGIRLPRRGEPEPTAPATHDSGTATPLPREHARDEPDQATAQLPATAPPPASTQRISQVGDTAPAPALTEQDDKPKRNGLVSLLRELAIVVSVALVISFLVKTFLAQPFWIPSGSMNDTLIRGDRVIVSKLTPGPFDLKRGDVVVFEDPGGWLPTVQNDRGPVLKGLEFVGLYPAGDNHLIKRVIGLPGDTVVCCDKKKRITVNGTPISESYLHEGDQPSSQKFKATVPAGKVWVMGDHRSDSSDSRFHDDGTGKTGSVPIDHITGRAKATVWPFDRMRWLSGQGSTFDKVSAP